MRKRPIYFDCRSGREISEMWKLKTSLKSRTELRYSSSG
ncbi:hypothetical protein PPTG_24691 [Phytophthora nicotianae INRA-310]|uniref:Uncharacterized protein n=1 Tax=Phytophthora nicotianae (strain INRA-310) TaxID=761204 RepID=W2PAY7_PHYN3|nr:hypothetical protein PPTG_24691 [Phytophthora nicotianae INRA-310]ETM98222.1 hypothetical protein PPTG_24691 [Phytophthora nicotianae INRA-310]